MASILKIIPNLTCEVYLDGEYQGLATVSSIFKIELRKGYYLLEFINQQDSSDKIVTDYHMKENDIDDLIHVDLLSVQNKRIEEIKEIERRSKSCHIITIEDKNSPKSVLDGIYVIGEPDNYKVKARYEIHDSDTGEIIELDQTYDRVHEFKEGLARVSKYIGYGDYQYGYIDTYGKIAIPLKYDDAGDFHEGLAWVSDNAIYHDYKYINQKDETVIKIKVPSLPSDFVNGYAKIKCDNENRFSGGEYSTSWDVIINKYGDRVIDHIAIPLKYDWFGSRLLEPSWNDGNYETCWAINTNEFQHDLLLVRSCGRYGYIDRSLQEVIPLQYSEATLFDRNGLAAARLDKWGIIDELGNNIVPHQYDYIGKFRNGFAACYIIDAENTKIKKWGVLDMSGVEIVPCEYKDADQALQILANSRKE